MSFFIYFIFHSYSLYFLIALHPPSFLYVLTFLYSFPLSPFSLILHSHRPFLHLFPLSLSSPAKIPLVPSPYYTCLFLSLITCTFLTCRRSGTPHSGFVCPAPCPPSASPSQWCSPSRTYFPRSHLQGRGEGREGHVMG